jgi:hypothetical protein
MKLTRAVAVVGGLLCLTAFASQALASLKPLVPRRVNNLDGRWEVEQGSLEAPPTAFTHTVPVPGLVDLAQPAFAEVGKKSRLREAFWYRRAFKVEGPVPEVALLKIHKARYGTKVWLNAQPVGEHVPCFTPGYFDLKPHLQGQGQVNELLIRVGADRESLPKGMPTGWDFEKYLFLPGIYDSVEVILTAAPSIVNLQTVPDLEKEAVRVVSEIRGGHQGGTAAVRGEVREARSGKLVGANSAAPVRLGPGAVEKVDFTIRLPRCRWWSPEQPFLYELRVSTGADAAKTRFGMRSFCFEPNGKYALLNGKRYFLRGSNVTIYRFFEDAARAERPWRADWVRGLHQKFKTMHWNSLRYCIGFPPEFWYDIADEEGILIQDEFPIWTLGDDPEKLQAARIIPEYTEWLRERWNHPGVVIWDAQNESSIAATGQALQAVRHLDLSNRPWENGWAEPQSLTDCVEAHPYLFIRDWTKQGRFRMSELAKLDGRPSLQAAQRKLKVPIIINEYAWLWLTREGNPTCLTTEVYDHLLGPNSTAAQRRQLYARLLAAKTEFWRAHRECAGVMHFCGLGYSRPGDKPRPEGGATSDHWIDLEKLVFEPNFATYVRDAFSPVGVMLDFWEEQAAPGARLTFQVYVINDLAAEWKGKVRLGLSQDGRQVSTQTQACRVGGFGREALQFAVTAPATAGRCTLSAEVSVHGRRVRSLRDFKVSSAD